MPEAADHPQTEHHDLSRPLTPLVAEHGDQPPVDDRTDAYLTRPPEPPTVPGIEDLRII